MHEAWIECKKNAELNGEAEDEDEADYAPALPPDLAVSRASHHESEGSSKRIQGPALPSALRRSIPAFEDDDDDYGPMPLPAGMSAQEKDGVTEFLEKEERRRKQVEVRGYEYCLRFLSK